MPKLKTKSGAAKRFKVTGKGKVKFKKTNLRHILTGKTTKNKSKYRKGAYLVEADAPKVRLMLQN